MTKVLGACAAAAVLALAAPGTAQAAQGVLVIDGAANEDPSGCYPLGDFAPSQVLNLTDGVAWVWSGPNCDGRVEHPVFPGQATVAHGRSVFIE
ncbi:hypothetical protein OOK31_21355 [Streptomyces sp. NBC_00249]|uniref:hypothetical protein n=1 Tax=Streptomyces sp. NBC_00249 TaxID=2975690 RepID=UPI0022514222|nr:hypothetical protein [Streptomyces sp. NBC_00249]MCX5196413.1 hypothetical protein [Streptomyces sp. NBC_00249]